MDVLCQAKSGMGKTAVFVLSVLQQLDPKPGEVSAIVLCHTRELAYQVGFTRGGMWLVACMVAPAVWVYQCIRPRKEGGQRTPSRIAVSCTQICHEFERFSTRLRNVK
eukprot:scaffold196938_cov17-Tisochrysis_lutea.AAC.1